MKLFIISAVLVGCLALAASPSQANGQSQGQSHPPPVADRQARTVASNSINGPNSLGGGGHSSNTIEHTSAKSRIEFEKRQVQDFLTTKNIFKSIIKLLFGNPDEISATSRNVLGVLNKMLDLLKNTFGQKSRSGTARTIKDSAEDAASAGVSMLQGYVRSVLAQDDKCVLRYLCQASHEAVRDGREIGYVVASIGGYASSYLLDGVKPTNFNKLQEASSRGRHKHEDCFATYPDCPE